MDEDEIALEIFRLRMRLAYVQELTLKNTLLMQHLVSRKSVAEIMNDLKAWLDNNSATADAAYGGAFRDPGLTALYGDEVRAITEDMKKMAGKIAAILTGNSQYEL